MTYKAFISFFIIATNISCASAEEQTGWWAKIKSWFGATPTIINEDRGEGSSRIAPPESTEEEQKELRGAQIEPYSNHADESSTDLPGGINLDGNWKGGNLSDSGILPTPTEITPEDTDPAGTSQENSVGENKNSFTNETAPNTMMPDMPQATPAPTEPTAPTTSMPDMPQAIPPITPDQSMQEMPQAEPRNQQSQTTDLPQIEQEMIQLAPEDGQSNPVEQYPADSIPGAVASQLMPQPELFTQQDPQINAFDENM